MRKCKRLGSMMLAACLFVVGSSALHAGDGVDAAMAPAVATSAPVADAAVATGECPTGAETATAACGKCGDGYCNPRCGESADSCPRDCGTEAELLAKACGKCGDGYCNPRCGESADTCPSDCAVALEQVVLDIKQ